MTCGCTETALCEDCRTNLERDVYEPRNYDELERRHRELRVACTGAVDLAISVANLLIVHHSQAGLLNQQIRALHQISAALDRDRDGTL